MNFKEKIFKYRSYIPIPFIFVMLIFAKLELVFFVSGFLIVIVGELIRFWGVSIVGSETRTTKKLEGTQLVISGPYAYVRNPLYIGNMLIYCGMCIMSNTLFPYLLIVVFIFFSVQYHFIVKLEEEFLLQKFGDDYKNYLKKVPKFFPNFFPQKKKLASQPKFDFKRGIKSENKTIQAIIIVMIAIFLISKFKN